MGTKVKAPAPRNYGQETRDTLQAQVDLAPDLFAAEKEFRGKYARLDLDIAKDLSPDMLDLYESTQTRLGAIDRDVLSAQRESDILDIERLGGRAKAAFESANPEQAALIKELNRQAQEDLALGGKLNAGERRELTQSSRAAQASRGFGYGINDAAIEAFANLQGSEERRRQRQGFAQSVVGMNQATGADPFMAILGRPSSTTSAAAGQVVGQTQGFNPGAMFSPESQYAGDIYNQNYQGNLAARTATARNRASIIGSTLGGIGKIGASAGWFCWVAREVYGANNPRWLLFREWMFVKSPIWLFKLYAKYGQRFSFWLKKHSWLKPIIRKFMDSKIKG